jgi:Sucrase/ferredoxin-like
VPAAEAARCADRSAARGEPLPGTASRFRSWLLVEQPGPWGHDALVQSDLPTDVGTRLRAVGRRLHLRVLLIKRRGRGRSRARACYVVYSGARERRIGAFEVGDPAELLDLDLEGMVRRRFEGVGRPVEGPLYLVCTHGKHDSCCARRGGPLYRALADLPAAWESTHVGGDRFAGNLICFPHGLYFGRVRPGEAPGVAGAYADGRIVLEHYRGRSAFSPPVQAAEQIVRERHGIVGVDDLLLVGHRELGADRHRVEFARGPERHVVEVEAVDRGRHLLTCKATTPHVVRGYAAPERI